MGEMYHTTLSCIYLYARSTEDVVRVLEFQFRIRKEEFSLYMSSRRQHERIQSSGNSTSENESATISCSLCMKKDTFSLVNKRVNFAGNSFHAL